MRAILLWSRYAIAQNLRSRSGIFPLKCPQSRETPVIFVHSQLEVEFLLIPVKLSLKSQKPRRHPVFMEERLQKLLSQWGIASRRRAEQLISQGRVRVNGQTVCLGRKADPHTDRIEVDGIPLGQRHRPELVYLLLHKPPGVVSTCFDPQGRKTVIELLPPSLRQGIHPVGRLDADSTGALLLTNDGALTFHLTHPRHQIAKTYRVWLHGNPPESILERWRQGVPLDGRPTQPARLRVLKSVPGERTLVEVMLTEGRNRQIRRVAELLGYPVDRLHRTAIGPIQLQPPHRPELSRGQYRTLDSSEIDALHAQLGIKSSRKVVSELEEYRR